MKEKPDLERDIKNCDWMVQKIKKSEIYSQNLYAALCNNEFQKLEIVPILKDETWSCSWRYSGGIISDIREEGDYIDWYCSGIPINDQQIPNIVPEGFVTQEIIDDLKTIGWTVVQNKNDN
jgi:hypothetical protein